MTARIFVHPRCRVPPAAVTLENTLLAHGCDLSTLRIFATPGHIAGELVHERGEVGCCTEFERLDGTRFTHRMGQITEAPEVA